MSGFVMNVIVGVVGSNVGLASVTDLAVSAADELAAVLPFKKVEIGTPDGEPKPISSVFRLRGFGMAGIHSLFMRWHLIHDQHS